MAGIEGPFKLTKFCGASVIRIQSSAGWQEQVSTLKVDLVEDDKDKFIPPETGTPMSFKFAGFEFHGLVQRWGKSKSTSGNPVYDVTLYSPVEILEAVQLILDAYRGVNLICPNLLNVFGYLEGEGDNFGGSGKNESGIPWYKIQDAIEAIQGGGTPFGPGIEYKGHKYKVDFGAVPDVPDFYRVGGTFISLNQAIRTVFEDAGYDFLVELKDSKGKGPHTISFKARSRLVQEPLGQIAAFVAGKDNIISFEEGAELRNDITCGVILGGEEEACIPMYDMGNGNTIWNFWGYQQSPFLVPFFSEGNQPIVESNGFGNDHMVYLNASPIGDIIGSPTGGPPIYECSAFEMRLALADFDSWSVFVARKRSKLGHFPDLPETLGLEVFPSIFGKDAFQENPQSFYANNADAVAGLSNNWQENAPIKALERIYNFVRNSAETYMGKQFMVRIPFWLKFYFEEETNRLLYNMNVNGDGYFPDYIGGWNSGPLGLSYENFNYFMNESGKFTPYVKFGGPDIVNVDLSTRNTSDMVIQGMEIFIRCNQDARILFTPAPAVLCSINEPLLSVWADPVGGINDIAWLCDMPPKKLMNILNMNNGEFPVKIHPWPFSPIGAAICLKSNEYTYGPWSKIGVPGKVKIEQNTGLVPWNYGGFETMRAAAEAQLAEIGATAQEEESGQVTFAGAPDISLGDQLNGSGPIVTSIDISISEQGVTTTYRMRSQTPAYGTFSKQNAERLRRLGTSAQDMRRSMRALADRMREHDRITTQARWTFMQQSSRATKKHQSTNVFQAFVVKNLETGKFTTQASAQTFAGAIGSSSAHDPEKYQATASMGLEGLLRPFSTKGGMNMPSFEDDSEADGISKKHLNPFQKGTDVLWAAKGEEYEGYYRGEDEDADDTRALGLRGPLVVVGWGRELSGKPIPNSAGDVDIQEMSNTYLDDHLNRFDMWKAGPVDLRWDKWNKVWSFPSIMIGIYKGNDEVQLEGVEDIVKVAQYLGGKIKEGQRVAIGYYPINAKWYIISAQC